MCFSFVTPALSGILLSCNPAFKLERKPTKVGVTERSENFTKENRLKSVLQIGRQKVEGVSLYFLPIVTPALAGMSFERYRLKSVLQGEKPKHSGETD